MAGQHERFLQQAIDLATANVQSGAGGPFGAVVVRAGEVIGTGANCVTRTHDPTGHAEVTAIRSACQRLRTFSLAGCTLYSSCEPCPMCLAATLWARVEELIYGATAEDAARAGFDDAEFYRQVRLPAGERALPMKNLLRDRAAESFNAWQEAMTRIDY